MNRINLSLACVVLVLLSACAKDPVAQASSSNSQIQAVKLTEIDGCTVFRFYDAGHYRYMAKCPVPTDVSISAHVSCGKSCARPEELQTVQGEMGSEY